MAARSSAEHRRVGGTGQLRQVRGGGGDRGGGARAHPMTSKWVPTAEGEGTLLPTPFARARGCAPDPNPARPYRSIAGRSSARSHGRKAAVAAWLRPIDGGSWEAPSPMSDSGRPSTTRRSNTLSSQPSSAGRAIMPRSGTRQKPPSDVETASFRARCRSRFRVKSRRICRSYSRSRSPRCGAKRRAWRSSGLVKTCVTVRQAAACPPYAFLALSREEIASLRVPWPASNFSNKPAPHQAGQSAAGGPWGQSNDGGDLTGQLARPSDSPSTMA